MNTFILKEPNVKQAVPFFQVANMEASLNYYVNGLGFELKNTWEDNGSIRWCWLQLGGAALMLQESGAVREQTDASTAIPGKGIEIYFICENSLEIYSQVKAYGLSSSEPFVGNNMWVVGLHDPDGYSIFFESATDVPEETTYSQWIKSESST